MSPPDAERPARRPAAQSNPRQKVATENRSATDGLRTRFEWRITWRREDWTDSTASKSRVFQRRHDANVFYRRLTSSDRLDLSRATVTVDRRDVGPWERLR